MEQIRNQLISKEKLKQLTAWVEPDIDEAFAKAATINNKSKSSLLKLLVFNFLKRNPVENVNDDLKTTGVRERRITVRFTVAEEHELNKRANTKDTTKSRYLASLFRVHISHAPYFSDLELQALREANRQLAAIGKNVNQIAKALNMSLDNAHLARAESLDEIRHAVEQHRQFIGNFVRENMKAWGIESDG